MGTNIYIRRKVPRMVPEFDETHVAKLSYGWKVHFDGSSMDNVGIFSPKIGSMSDLRQYLDSGDWELIDEYGDRVTLDYVLSHDDDPFNSRVSLDDYYDSYGYPWSRREFC